MAKKPKSTELQSYPAPEWKPQKQRTAIGGAATSPTSHMWGKKGQGTRAKGK